MAYVWLYEVYDVLTQDENKSALSKDLQRELSYMCDLRTDDDCYVFADMIRNRKAHVQWDVSTITGKSFKPLTVMQNAKLELKPTVYNLLLQKNIIYSDSIENIVAVK